MLPSLGFRVQGFISITKKYFKLTKEIQILGSLDDMGKLIKQYKIN